MTITTRPITTRPITTRPITTRPITTLDQFEQEFRKGVGEWLARATFPRP